MAPASKCNVTVRFKPRETDISLKRIDVEHPRRRDAGVEDINASVEKARLDLKRAEIGVEKAREETKRAEIEERIVDKKPCS